MEPGSWYLFIVLIVLVSLSAFFSSSETALASISRIKLLNMIEENVKNADIVQKLLESPQKLLSAILVGNNIVNIGASSLATAIAIEISPKYGVTIATVLMTIVVLIFGEITPKTFAAENSEKIALAVARPINFVIKVLTPFVKVFDVVTCAIIKILGGRNDDKTPTITEAELKTMVNVSHEEGVLEIDEREMINNVFDFGDYKAKDVMTPRTEMATVSKDAGYEEVIQVFKEEQFSRIPVYNEDIDDIIGILFLKDVFFVDDKENFTPEKYMREPFFTYESKEISKLLKEMRTNRIALAIVLDEYGGTSGLVTVEDMVEEIVGEIADEFDEDEKDDIEQVHENEYLVDGTTRIDDINEMLGTRLESDDVETIGGYVIGFLGRFAVAGETVTTDGLEIKVEEVEKNRITKLRVKVLPKENEEE
ncbi:hemolysin family protein [Anaerotignum faecicola]|nr:hemolysin family protein [Anaerotignum faecicola]